MNVERLKKRLSKDYDEPQFVSCRRFRILRVVLDQMLTGASKSFKYQSIKYQESSIFCLRTHCKLRRPPKLLLEWNFCYRRSSWLERWHESLGPPFDSFMKMETCCWCNFRNLWISVMPDGILVLAFFLMPHARESLQTIFELIISFDWADH